ncbi:hypothetical protein ACERK3_15665 [Phycisphaerales bacterium AB-hyl4]|uniref:Major facilitator superfamily (MFS) profile domain-containing protein n=1 Tax=Natronomicrosphaera hydrolytica TaxID=3242702 RepID=A0ABV4UAU1_9BACT
MKACAILSCVFGLMGIFVFGIPLGMAAIVLGVIGGVGGYSYAWAGMTLGIVNVLYVSYWLLRMMGEI